MNEQLEQLCQKWTEEEILFNKRANQYAAMDFRSSSSHWAARASQISTCRSELQEIIGLQAKWDIKES